VNRINRNFGRLILASKQANVAAQQRLMRQFHRVGLSIVHTKGWFHQEGIDGWLGVIDLAVAKQLGAYAGWSPWVIFKSIKGNRFAYLYQAIKNEIIDEIRRLARRSMELILSPDDETFELLASVRIDADREIHRQQLLRLVDLALEGVAGNLPFESILRRVRDWLGDPDQIPAESPATHAALVQHLSTSLDVSPQQARTYVRRFRAFAQHDEHVQNLMAALRSAGRDHARQDNFIGGRSDEEDHDGELSSDDFR
jgi:hypothetical protein